MPDGGDGVEDGCDKQSDGSDDDGRCVDEVREEHDDGKDKVPDGAEVGILEFGDEVVELRARRAEPHAYGQLYEDQDEGNDPTSNGENRVVDNVENTKDYEEDNRHQTSPLPVQREVLGAEFVENAHVEYILVLL